MAVRRAAPFPDPEFDVSWAGDIAMVWLWSRQRVREGIDVASARDRFEAEAHYLDQPHDAAAQVLTVGPGYEARLWRKGVLVASRWWPAPPDEATWELFLRTAGTDPSQWPLPEPSLPSLRPLPWRTQALADSLGGLRAFLPLLASIAGSLIAAAFAWQVGAGLRAQLHLNALEKQLAAAEAELSPVLSARQQAEDDLQAITRLLALRPPVPQTRLLAEASKLMDNTGWKITRWSQTNPELLEVEFTLANSDSQAIVSRWEASPLFAEVTPTLSRDGDGMTLRMRVLADDGSGTP